ncbi:MAG: hypothetical protein ABSF84_02120 [Acidimicrobiales bacterium]
MSPESRPGRPAGPVPRPLTITGVLLLDPHGHEPTAVESITFDDTGIGVVGSRGQDPRILPWEAMVNHAVEPWAGGVIPEWWVDPQLHRAELPVGEGVGALLTDPVATSRPLPRVESGAMISIQTRTGTYRFLRSGGDPSEIAARIADWAIRHQGPAGASSVTTVASRRHRRGGAPGGPTWDRVRPWLVVVLVVLIAAAVTLILLQSAGVIHLPFLGSGAAATSPDALLSRGR